MLTRQASLDAYQNNQQRIQQNQAGSGLLILAPAIAAVVIGSQYDASTSACAGGSYTIPLVTFLYVAGYVCIGWVSVQCVLQCIAKVLGGDEGAMKCGLALQAPALCFLVFNLVWAGIGLYIWDNEMSDDCQGEPIGQMILAWSIIQYALIGCICCCVCFIFCVVGAASAANN
mmetsp:Transcript_27881/g.44203  ORF Transcript_27881/g.44203 Transcript_27881/m.44203 type:complete len:173 (-) Transcript_27881:53-571(-)